MQPSDESDLLRRAQQGDMEAFADLQDALDAPIRRFVWRLIGTSLEEDDIVQDSLIALYLNLDRIQPVENLRPYLFRIVRNRCYDLLRRRKRFEHLSLDDEPMETYVSMLDTVRGEQPDEVVDWLLIQLEVQTAIDRLPEHQRQTLILFAQENLGYQEIADVMNTSIGTVKSRLFYAKKTLRQLVSTETLEWLDANLNGAARSEPASTATPVMNM